MPHTPTAGPITSFARSRAKARRPSSSLALGSAANTTSAARGRLQTLVGTVVCDKAQKSITVRVDRRVAHPVYGKVVRKFKKYIVHDEKDEARGGDTVEIAYTRPSSKRKTFRLARILRRAEG